jgi:hypothetical protein
MFQQADNPPRYRNALHLRIAFLLVGSAQNFLVPSSMGSSCSLLESASSYNLLIVLYLYKVCCYSPSRDHRLKFVLEVEDPKLMLIIGCVGLISNLISAGLIHGTPLALLHVSRLIHIKITVTMVIIMVMAVDILLLRKTSSNRAPKHYVFIPSPHHSQTFPNATKVTSIRFNSQLVDVVNEMLLH